MSLNIPPAVTWAPAPGPRTIRGCFLYLVVVKAMMLSEPASCAKGWSFLYLRNSTSPCWLSASTTPTYLKTFGFHTKKRERKQKKTIKNTLYEDKYLRKHAPPKPTQSGHEIFLANWLWKDDIIIQKNLWFQRSPQFTSTWYC